MRTKRVLAAFVSAVLAAGLGIPPAAETAPAADVDSAVKQVLAYEQAVKSVKFTWVAKVFYPKGSIKMTADDSWDGIAYEAPSEDTTVDAVTTLTIEGQKVRYDIRRMVWDGKLRAFAPYDQSGTILNGEARDLCWNFAYISRDSLYRIELDSGPVFAAYRLLDPVLGWADHQMASLVGAAEHDGHPCLVIDVPSRSGGSSRYRCWLAQDMSGCIVRLQRLKEDGSVISEAEMRYAKDEKVGWHLQSWDLNVQSVKGSSSNTVTEVQINEPIDPAVFGIKFPAGMEVYDMIRGTQYISDGEGTAPRADTLSGQAMDKFVEKVRKETAQPRPPRPAPAQAATPAAPPVQAAAPPPRGPLSPWLLVGGGVLILLLIAAIALSRRRPAG